ncbi:MAG: HD domain-containing protein [Candidatus Firestonebacteria bacterium]|nr:HD domain-containing protein [Candidatus Firestonebacteria bacterium]
MLDLEKLSGAVRLRFQGAKGSHDWEHTQRVLALALHLARVEGAEADIVHCAALLHDIARSEEDLSNGKIDHAIRGAELTAGILKDLGGAPDFIRRVAHCIAAHRFRGTLAPETLEAKVLFDADKLDAIGAVGIGRAFLFAGEVGANLHNPGVKVENTQPYTEEDTAYREFQVKLRKVKDRVLTVEGRRLAQARHEFMTAFFERLNQEVAGDL